MEMEDKINTTVMTFQSCKIHQLTSVVASDKPSDMDVLFKPDLLDHISPSLLVPVATNPQNLFTQCYFQSLRLFLVTPMVCLFCNLCPLSPMFDLHLSQVYSPLSLP